MSRGVLKKDRGSGNLARRQAMESSEIENRKPKGIAQKVGFVCAWAISLRAMRAG